MDLYGAVNMGAHSFFKVETQRIPHLGHGYGTNDDSNGSVGSAFLSVDGKWRRQVLFAWGLVINVALLEVWRLHDMHVTVKDLEAVLCHGAPPSV